MKPQHPLRILGYTACVLAAAATVFQQPAVACPATASHPSLYQRRSSPNRCEGIRRQNVGAAFELVSFASNGLGSNYGNTISLRIPNLGSTPRVSMRSYTNKSYQLDSFTPSSSANGYIFNIPTTILRNEDIPTRSLRALASISGSQPIYVPVILSRSSGTYEFVFFSATRATVSSFEIRRNNQVIHRDSRTNPRRGEIPFTWNPQNQPAGLYQLYITAEQRQRGQRPERISLVLPFRHHPNWLR